MTEKRYAMATQGHQYSGDALADGTPISLSWPINGTREVVALDIQNARKDLSPRFLAMIGDGMIEEVDDEPTAQAIPEQVKNRLFAAGSDAAKAHMAIKPAPVVIERHVRTDEGLQTIRTELPDIETIVEEAANIEQPKSVAVATTSARRNRARRR